MEYLFANAGFISLNERPSRVCAYARGTAGFSKRLSRWGTREVGSLALRFTVKHIRVRLKYRGDPPTGRH